MILLVPPQLINQARRQIEISADLHGIKNPVVTEHPCDNGWRKYEITEGAVSSAGIEQPPPVDVDQSEVTQGPHTP